MPSSLKDALTEYAERLRCLFGARLRDVRLFGSFARGDADEDSDVDVLVLVDDLTDCEIGIAAGEAAPVILSSGLPLAPLPMSTARFDELRRRDAFLHETSTLKGFRCDRGESAGRDQQPRSARSRRAFHSLALGLRSG